MNVHDSLPTNRETDPDGEDKSPTHFSLTNFLFGNVDKHGDLEEFGDDEEERRALNQLGRAHVSELDQAVECVIVANNQSAVVDDNSATDIDSSKSESCAEDFYDINEVINEPDIDLSKVEVGAVEDDEDYDADDSQTTKASESLSSSVITASAVTESIKNAPTTPDSVDESSLEHQEFTGKVDDSKCMPPPQIIPPISPALKTTQTFNPITSNIENQPAECKVVDVSAPICVDVEQPAALAPPPSSSSPLLPPLPVTQQAPLEAGTEAETPGSHNKLNTPLGNMMPEEYANVDIRDLFPEYDPDRTPRWSKLFKPVYPVSLYKDICCTTLHNPLYDDDREHIFFQYLDMGRVAKLEEILNDDTEKLRAFKGSAAEASANAAKSRQKKEEQAKAASEGFGDDHNSKKPSWRNGPAKLWYDMLGLPHAVDVSKVNFSSLIRSEVDKAPSNKEENQAAMEEKPPEVKQEVSESDPCLDLDSEKENQNVYARIPVDVLVPINQVNWEDDIIWDAQQSANRITAGHKANAAYAGWFPTNQHRTMAKFQDAYCSEYPGVLPSKSTGTNTERADPSTWRSIFPVENYALISGEWQNDIIWDINDIPRPSLLTLDPNDENLLPLDMPMEEGPAGLSAIAAKLESHAAKRAVELTPGKMNKNKEKDSSKARLLLGRHGLLKEDEKADGEEEPEEETPLSPQKKDPFNLSNDEFYYPRQMSSTRTAYVSGPNIGYTSGAIIQHSTPAMELRHPFFPLHLNVQRLRHFHRPNLKRYHRGSMSQYDQPHPVCNLAKHIRKKAKQREEERAACGGGEIFFMRTPSDLSGMDGDLILAEYSEEFPSLMMQVGMNTRMLNYYKRPSSKEAGSEVAPPHLKYGELVYVHQSPFLGQLKPDQCLQKIDG